MSKSKDIFNPSKKLWAPWRMEYIKRETPAKDKCVLCIDSIKDNDRENLILFRGENAFVIMNLYPYNNGHLMVCPYSHVDSLKNLENTASSEIMRLAIACSNILQIVMNAEGFNLGANIGSAGGAGIDDHLHFHIVPRWNGDTNFMPVVGQTKVIMSGLIDTYDQLIPYFSQEI